MTRHHIITAFVTFSIFVFVVGCERNTRETQKREQAVAQGSQEKSDATSVRADNGDEPTDTGGAATPSDEEAEPRKLTTVLGVHRDDDTLSVEIEPTEDEAEALSKLFPDEARRGGDVKWQPRQLPDRIRGFEHIDILTPSGVKTTKTTGIRMEFGPGGAHFMLLAKAPRGVGGTWEYTIATPVDEMHPEAVLEVADPQTPHAKIKPKLENAFLGPLDDELRERARQKSQPEHFRVTRGRFGEPFVKVVVVSVPMGEFSDGFARAMFLADDTASKLNAIKEPGRAIETINVLAVADPDGDGVDGVLYESRYYEGQFFFWMEFEDGEATSRKLMGDGA